LLMRDINAPAFFLRFQTLTMYFRIIQLALFFFCFGSVTAQQTVSNTAVTKSGEYISFDSTPIYYEVRGVGRPVVLVHGFIVNGESWKRTKLYDTLLKKGFQVIILDMRGNGRSGKPHELKSYLDDAETKDITGLVSFLQIPSYDVVGYSRGSIIVSRLVLADSRIGKAVIGGMGTGFTNPDWPRRQMFYEALMGKDVPELAGMVKYVQDSKLDQLALAYLQKAQPSTTAQELAKIKKPVLVICGDNDSDNGSAADLSSMIPGSMLVRVPGDHNNAVRSQEFAGEVTKFLTK
jgi:pimeloyl-ACP methyl ester carboxylesterase